MAVELLYYLNIMLRHLKLLALCCFFAFTAFSQPGFNNKYELNSPGSSLKNALYDDNNHKIYIASAILDTAIGLWGISLVTADTMGNILSIFSYFDTVGRIDLGYSANPDMIFLNDGNIAIVGGKFDGINNIIVIFSKEGQFIKTISIPIINFTSGPAPYELAEYKNGYLIQGGLVNTQNYIQVYLIRLDSEGNIMWEKRYSPANTDQMSRCMRIFDDNTILIAGTVNNASTYPIVNPWSRSHIMAVDSNGAIKWEWQSALNYGLVTDIKKMPDGDWLFLQKKYIMTFGLDSVLGEMHLVRSDSNFNVRWRKLLSPTPWSWGLTNEMVPTPDGHWIISEHVAIYGPEFEWIDPGKKGGCLTKVSSDGEIFWQTCDTARWEEPILPYFTEEFVIDHVVLPSGSSILVGSVNRYQAPARSYGWMFKVDANGCMYAPCSVPVEEPRAPGIVLSVYPNPASEHATVRLPELNRTAMLEAYDALGRLMAQAPVAPGQEQVGVPVGDWAQGVYVLRLVQAGRVLGVGRVVVR